MKVAVIDSGIDSNNKRLDTNKFSEIIFDENLDGKDTIGHGTALSLLYHNLFPNVFIYSFKVFEGFKTDVALVIKALEYIDKNLEVDLINFSIGMSLYSKELEDVCLKLHEKGVVLLAAFDNNGILSYPASFDFVIGVSSTSKIVNTNEYIFLQNSPLNILGYSGTQVVDWLDNQKKVVNGNSFILPYIAKHIICGQEKNSEIITSLKNGAVDVINFKNNIVNAMSNRKIDIKKIRKSIVFPINKEIINLLNNKHRLSFEINDVYDFKYSSKLGKNIDVFLHKINDDKVIKSIASLNWRDDFDTFILGHLESAVSQLNSGLLDLIVKKCLHFKKNLVIFDSIDIEYYQKLFKENDCFVYTPNFSKNIQSYTFGELWYNPVPTLCISGTSSKQGKFNLQLDLKYEMEKQGYSVGQIGTEPNSELLNFDYAYPNGYGTSKVFSDGEDIMFLNQLAHELCDNDLIMIGTQSNMVPYARSHINSFPLLQRNILLGTQPDATVLCVNSFDTSDYISRTISYIESYHESIVIALAVFPIEKKIDSITGEYSEKVLNEMELSNLIFTLEKYFKIPVFINGKDTGLLARRCIHFFTEETL